MIKALEAVKRFKGFCRVKLICDLKLGLILCRSNAFLLGLQHFPQPAFCEADTRTKV